MGLLSAQCVHAAGESSPGNIPAGTHAVVLGCSYEELTALAARLPKDVSHVLIHENDAPYEGQLMAIGFTPAPRAVVYPYVRSLRLLREVRKAV